MHTNCIHTWLCFGVDPPLPAAPLAHLALPMGNPPWLSGFSEELVSFWAPCSSASSFRLQAGILDGIQVSFWDLFQPFLELGT